MVASMTSLASSTNLFAQTAQQRLDCLVQLFMRRPQPGRLLRCKGKTEKLRNFSSLFVLQIVCTSFRSFSNSPYSFIIFFRFSSLV